MRVLVIGNGGREHALCWKLAQSPLVEKIYCAPGNAGTAQEARVENLAIAVNDYDNLLEFAVSKNIGLTVVGPEQPLVDGLVDRLQAKKMPVFGPTQACARLEGSKIFAKQLMTAASVPTAPYQIFDHYENAKQYLENTSYPCVLKADGLAAGKGVVICKNSTEALKALQEVMYEKIYGQAGNRVLIEEFLPGKELSILAVCRGREFQLFPPARDHKSLYEGGKGPNTGGMGAFTPVSEIPESFLREVGQIVFTPVLEYLAEKGTPFSGVLYAGLMISDSRPYVLEFNVRFGDPETQPLLFHLESDLLPALLSVATGTTPLPTLQWRSGVSLCVVLASGGYPGKVESGVLIPGLANLRNDENFKVFHAGTKLNDKMQTVTAGGRVLGVTAHAEELQQARALLYENLPQCTFAGAQFRKDIGL